MIAMHPNVQEKVYAELREVFGNSPLKIDQYSLNKLNYLEMVFKEALRLFPIGAITGRFTSADVKLGNFLDAHSSSNCLFNNLICLSENHTIPKGTNILLNILKLQRNPKYWGNDAESFIPERFEPDRIKNVHPYAFIPFLSEFS
jgi:cytochrome P450